MVSDIVEDMQYSPGRRGWVGFMRLAHFHQYADAELFQSWMYSEKKSRHQLFENGYLRVTIQDKSRKGPTREQEDALRYLKTQDRDICERCVDALKAEQERVRSQGWLDPLEPGEAAPGPVILFTGVEIAKCHRKGCAYIAIDVDTAWEIEHDVGILVHPAQRPLVGFEVMEMVGGDEGEAFVEPEAKNAVISIREQLGAIVGILRGIVDTDSARASASELKRYAKHYKRFQLSLERPGRDECFHAVYEDEQFQNRLQDVLCEFDRVRREIPQAAKYVASAHSNIQSLV
jgi:hypothetical protein